MKRENDRNKIMFIKASLFENDSMLSINPATENCRFRSFLVVCLYICYRRMIP